MDRKIVVNYVTVASYSFSLLCKRSPSRLGSVREILCSASAHESVIELPCPRLTKLRTPCRDRVGARHSDCCLRFGVIRRFQKSPHLRSLVKHCHLYDSHSLHKLKTWVYSLALTHISINMDAQDNRPGEEEEEEEEEIDETVSLSERQNSIPLTIAGVQDSKSYKAARHHLAHNSR